MKENQEPKKTKEDWEKIYLQRFKDLHNNFSDEIPEKMIDGENPENHKYKVRGNWFSGVKNSLAFAESIKMFPEDFNEEWKSFFKSYADRMLGTHKKVRTTKEEIDTANKLLIKAQEILSNQLK